MVVLCGISRATWNKHHSVLTTLLESPHIHPPSFTFYTLEHYYWNITEALVIFRRVALGLHI
jgi:hypothetical protein